MALTREQILAADDLPIHSVDVPEWGGPVYYRHLSAIEQAGLEKLQASVKDVAEGEYVAAILRAAAGLIVRSVCDEDGKLIFTEADVDALIGKSADPLMRVFNEIKRVILGDESPSE